jgi:putative transposase
MAWKEVKVLEQRKLFIIDYLSNNYNISQLCIIYNISRPTAYLWIKRFKEKGELGLIDQSSAPYNQPFKTPDYIIGEILNLKCCNSNLGPKKIHAILRRKIPDSEMPSCTTVANILKRNGLVIPRKLRKRFAERNRPLAHAKENNDVWSADFKGWFKTKDNYKCEPFTLTDNASRYLLKCSQLISNKEEHVWGLLDIAFREYGLPLFLRTDNGPPFASKGMGRLSKLSIKLIKAGVIPDFIDPGKPQQNGRHERMHGTLKREYIKAEYSFKEQIKKFDEFQEYFNYERPHESIGQVTPGSIYTPSNRIWNGKFRSPEYDDSYKKVKVEVSGQIKVNGQHIYLSRSLVGEYIGLKTHKVGYEAYYGQIYLGELSFSGELTVKMRGGRLRNKFKEEFY